MDRFKRFDTTTERAIPPFTLYIESGGPKDFQAQLKLGTDPPRLLNARTCEEVVDAVLVIVRIWATRDQKTDAMAPAKFSADAASAERDPQLQLRAESEVSAPGRTEAKSGTTIPVSAPSGSDRASNEQGSANAVLPRGAFALPRLRLESGLSGAMGVAPGMSLGLVGRVGIALNDRKRVHLRLGLMDSKSSSRSAHASVVWSRVTMLQVGACAQLDRRANVLVDICVDLSLGRFRAGAMDGPIITHTQSVSRPWLAVGPAIRSEVPILRDHLGIWVEASLPIEVLRERLVYVQPTTDVHKTWIVAPTIQLGLRCSFGGSSLPAAGTAH